MSISPGFVSQHSSLLSMSRQAKLIGKLSFFTIPIRGKNMKLCQHWTHWGWSSSLFLWVSWVCDFYWPGPPAHESNLIKVGIPIMLLRKLSGLKLPSCLIVRYLHIYIMEIDIIAAFGTIESVFSPLIPRNYPFPFK